MGTRTFDLTVPLSLEDTFDLLLQAGERLPKGEKLGGAYFGRWENTLADHQSASLEWKMFDHNFATNRIQASLSPLPNDETKVEFKIHRSGQLFDPAKLYSKTLRLLLDPFIGLVKEKVASGQTGQ
jgi:hypothetical protein